MSLSINNPYADVDFSTVEQHKVEFHNHVRGWAEAPHEVVDLYSGDGEDMDGQTLTDDRRYTCFAVGDKGAEPMRWPWTEFTQAPDAEGDWEDRDPENVGLDGVISFPAAEITKAQHVNTVFSTLTNDDIGDPEDRYEMIQMIVDDDTTDEPETMIVDAHPSRRYEPDDIQTGIDEHTDQYADISMDDGLIGFEVMNARSTSNAGGGIKRRMQDVALWDGLLEIFMPDRPIWGFGVDDPHTDWSITGGTQSIDKRVTVVLLDPSDFDPSNQDASREAAASAFKTGQLFFGERNQFNGDPEAGATIPTIDDIDIDGTEITITASDFSQIRWISSGNLVGTGSSIEVSGTHIPYIRAEVWGNPDSVLMTQPFGVDVEDSTYRFTGESTHKLESDAKYSFDPS